MVTDAHLSVTRLAEIYDALDPDRSDLDAYLTMVDEFGASSILDIGSGTGTFASLLAHRDTFVSCMGYPRCAARIGREFFHG